MVETRTLLRGGRALERAEVAQVESPGGKGQVFDIDTELSYEQRMAM